MVVSKYCKNLVYMGTREMSFEEMKALQPKYKYPKATTNEYVFSFSFFKISKKDFRFVKFGFHYEIRVR